jgi:uncharacterized protein
MILDLREFEEFPAQALVHAGPGEIDSNDDRVVQIEKVTAELAVQKTAQEFFCQGRVKARLELECARCLASYPVEISEDIDFIVCSETLVAERDIVDDEDYVYFKGNDLTVDIVEPVRQAMVLGLPLKPLCGESCKGLCPSCGANLNKSTCACDTRAADPRWEGLKDLFSKE